MIKKPRKPKAPKLTRREERIEKMYRANPEAAAEDDYIFKTKPTATKVTKPKMQMGGATKKLKRYQEGEEVQSAPATTTSAPAPRTFADTYKANLTAGMRPGQAKRIAKGELGLKSAKVDPNAVINAVGNVGSAAITTFGNRGGGGSPAPDFKKGGVKRMQAGGPTKNKKRMMFKTGGMVNANKKVAASKVATGKAGGISKAISKVAVKAASPKGRVGGTSKAPTKATPQVTKKKLGGSMKGKSC